MFEGRFAPLGRWQAGEGWRSAAGLESQVGKLIELVLVYSIYIIL